MNLSITPEGSTEYVAWLRTLHPRTCLTVHWLADIGALPEPGLRVRDKALRFSNKSRLLEVVMVRSNEELESQTVSLMYNGDMDIYIAWHLYLRYVECVPRQHLLPDGHKKVMSWIRSKLRRFELTDAETEVELWHQARRMMKECGHAEYEWPEVN